MEELARQQARNQLMGESNYLLRLLEFEEDPEKVDLRSGEGVGKDV